MVSKKLERNDSQDRADGIWNTWKLDGVVGNPFQLLGAVAAGKRDDRTFTGLDLLDVVEVFGKNGVIRCDEEGGKIGADQRDNAVFELSAGMPLREEIGDLFHFERAFHGDREIELAAKEEHPVNVRVFFCDRLDRVAQLENLLNLFGQCFQRFDDSAAFDRGKVSHSSEQQTD